MAPEQRTPVCNPEHGCGLVQGTIVRVDQHERRLAKHDEEIETLHDRLTQMLKDTISDLRAKNMLAVTVLFSSLGFLVSVIGLIVAITRR